MLSSDTDIRYIKGVGEKRAQLLSKLGVFTLRDLIYLFPRAYRDLNAYSLIREAPLGENCCVRAIVGQRVEESRIRKGMTIYKTVVTDGQDILHLTIFNNKYAAQSLEEGKEFIFCGKISFAYGHYEMASPAIEKIENIGRLLPVYPQTAGLSSKTISAIMKNALALYDPPCDVIPETVREKYGLCPIGFALNTIHFPQSQKDADIAKKRLMFEELLVLQLGMAKLKTRNRRYCENVIKIDYTQEFLSLLPFKMTNAQLNAVYDGIRDMGLHENMNRLLQGDVGSGKTCVAAALIYSAVKNGMQCALMAPTGILACQHFSSISRLFENTDIRVSLLTGSVKASEKKKIKQKAADGEIDLLIGTHAVIQNDVTFKNLGLVVTDEQHRFGVKQRDALFSKGKNPHLLVMSATPIPRTLALIIYGDLDLSVINELPPGRQKISTYAVDESYRERIYNYIKTFLDRGLQAYIVCPLVEEGENAQLVSASEYAKEIQETAFKDYRVGLLHGKMKPAEKDKVMEDFSAGKIQLLVSTTVVEVGVDVEKAVVMVVENAERFGLSQLHQLRGRVGRGKEKASCVLISSDTGEISKRRLEIMKKTTDGFKIADEDLRLRGPGDFFGEKQHGLPDIKIADMLDDMVLCNKSREAAQEIIKNDPLLTKRENLPLNTEIHALFGDKYNMN